MNCQCGKPFVEQTPVFETLVGYGSQPGHDHDDNCKKASFYCEDGHETVLSERRRCSTPKCDWKGKLTCFCHPGDKINALPHLPLTKEWRDIVGRRTEEE